MTILCKTFGKAEIVKAWRNKICNTPFKLCEAYLKSWKSKGIIHTSWKQTVFPVCNTLTEVVPDCQRLIYELSSPLHEICDRVVQRKMVERNLHQFHWPDYYFSNQGQDPLNHWKGFVTSKMERIFLICLLFVYFTVTWKQVRLFSISQNSSNCF